MIKITKLKIGKFRHFQQGTEIQIGKNVTLIAGCNGTGKSSLLGMIGQPIGFPDKSRDKSLYTRVYDDFDLLSIRTPYGKPYRTAYSEVFRLSEQNDTPQNIEYKIFLDGDIIAPSYPFSTSGLVVKGQTRDGQKPRMVAHETHKKGEGNFPHPVIFLGLNRLRPLAQMQKLRPSDITKLDKESSDYWKTSYRRIMGSRKPDITSEKVNAKSYKGEYDSIKTDNYDSGGASSGEDNIGQIISSIISFRYLKNYLGDKYQGGVLLIDELDATLHLIAQNNLLEYLVKASDEFNLQIIATTHSLLLIKDLRKHGEKVKLAFLIENDGKVVVENKYDYDMMMDVLADQLPPKPIQKHSKTTVLFEDDVAVAFFRQVTRGIFSKYIHVPPRNSNCHHMPESILRHFAAYIAARKVPEFMKIVCVLDPDCTDRVEKQNVASLLCLPGNMPIECLIFNLIDGYSDSDFYDRYHRCRQNLFLGDGVPFRSSREGEKKEDETKPYKDWFKKVLRKMRLRIDSPKLYRDWSDQHRADSKRFCNEFLKALIAVGNKECKKSQKDIENTIVRTFS